VSSCNIFYTAGITFTFTGQNIYSTKHRPRVSSYVPYTVFVTTIENALHSAYTVTHNLLTANNKTTTMLLLFINLLKLKVQYQYPGTVVLPVPVIQYQYYRVLCT
jgi:hypothetical protein